MGSQYIQTYLHEKNFDLSILGNLVDKLTHFGHSLCLSQHGICLIEMILNTCLENGLKSVLIDFIDNVIGKHFYLLIKHQLGSKVIKHMLQSRDSTVQQHMCKCMNKQLCRLYGDSLNGVDPCVEMEQQTSSTRRCTVIGNQSHMHSNMYNSNNNSNNNNNGNNKPNVLLSMLTDKTIGGVIVLFIQTSCALGMACQWTFMFSFMLNNICLLSCHEFGYRVIESCISEIPYSLKFMLFHYILSKIQFLINDKYGHVVVEKCLIISNNNKNNGKNSVHPLAIRQTDPFIKAILFDIDVNIPNLALSDKNAYSLPYQLRDQFLNDILVNKKQEINFIKFGFGKYSSNICQLAFNYATKLEKLTIIKYIVDSILPTSHGVKIQNTFLFGMVNHKYGSNTIKNIVQSAIKFLSSHDPSVRNKCNNKITHFTAEKDLIQSLLLIDQFFNQKHNNDPFSTSFTFCEKVLDVVQQSPST